MGDRPSTAVAGSKRVGGPRDWGPVPGALESGAAQWPCGLGRTTQRFALRWDASTSTVRAAWVGGTVSKNRRDAIRMTADEIEAFIESHKSLQVGTIEADGSVHLSTLWFAVVDGRIVFETYTKSQKIKNLERDSRITVLLEDGTVYEKLRGVMIKGNARLVSDPNEVHPLALAVMRRNQPDIPEELLDKAAETMAAKRTAVVIEPRKVISWDHTKLDVAY